VTRPYRGTWTAPRLWELFFAVTFVGVLALSQLVDDGTSRVGITAFMTAMLIWYLVLGRSAVLAQRASWRGYVFQAGLLLQFGGALAASGAVSYLLFALSPLVYKTVPGRWAHGGVIAYAFAPAVVFLARTGDVSQTLRVLVPIGGVVIAMSVVMSVTISRTERLSDERAALIDELASSRAEVARLSREAGVAEERQRLAREIHDTIAQGLSSVVMLIEAAARAEPEQASRHLTLAAKTARENLDEARAIVGALTPTQLSDTSLPDALRRVTARFSAEAGLPGDFSVAGTPVAVPTAVDVVLLRVVQEALTNVRKHSGARSVTVRLSYADSAVAVEVADDGSGFEAAARHPGYGLGAMRGRVEQVGGQLVVTSAPGAGTTVWTEIPA
jgi:signal transduction histidine kinase